MPLERDIDIIQAVGLNISFKINNCSLSHPCPSNTSSPVVNVHQAWTGASKDVLYIAFPVMILWGVLTGLLNLVVLIRQVRVSNDSYLIGLVVASVMLLFCGGILKVTDYLGHMNIYHYVYGYVKSLNDWLWFTSIWLLIVMSVERSMVLTQTRNRQTCSLCQASVICVMVFCVCFISALPQFWEFEVLETFDYGTNQTWVMSQLSAIAETAEYKLLYFWYMISITIFLPYPLLILMMGILSKGMHQSNDSRQRLSIKHASGNLLSRKVSEEMHLTRLYIALILLYILFTGPLTFLRLIDRVAPHWTSDSVLYWGLHSVFEFAFYFYYSIQFLLFISYSDKFRHSFLKTCCCCCCCCCCCQEEEKEWRPVNREWQEPPVRCNGRLAGENQPTRDPRYMPPPALIKRQPSLEKDSYSNTDLLSDTSGAYKPGDKLTPEEYEFHVFINEHSTEVWQIIYVGLYTTKPHRTLCVTTGNPYMGNQSPSNSGYIYSYIYRFSNSQLLDYTHSTCGNIEKKDLCYIHQISLGCDSTDCYVVYLTFYTLYKVQQLPKLLHFMQVCHMNIVKKKRVLWSSIIYNMYCSMINYNRIILNMNME